MNDQAARLGFTTASVAQMLYVSTKGAAISTMYEGNNPINIVLRMEKNKRQNISNIENIYIQSPVTKASVPLRQVAEVVPQWQPGRLMHRNGVRCITVRSETTNGVLSSELLAEIKPLVENLNLPTGYKIEFEENRLIKMNPWDQCL